VLYSLIKDSMKLDAETVVLDICCGTGTIGITLANVKFVDLNFEEKNLMYFRTLNKSLELK
jgi:16S rRNA G1207 methylase RsmC